MLTIGDRLPPFSLKAVVSNDSATAFSEIQHDSFPDKWMALLFYPKDFTFVCPTELRGFAERFRDFEARDAQILSVSTDSEYVHLAWRRSHEGLQNLPYPMVSDIRRHLSGSLGLIDHDEGVARRATLLVDPDGVIRYVSVHDDSVGRSPEEILRVLDALKTKELCPCNWRKGDATLQPA